MENLFQNYTQKKGNGVGKGIGKNKRAINTKSLYDFSLKCDDIKRGCDWMSFVSMHTNSLKVLCPCFNKIVNDTNSDQLVIPGDQLNGFPFESLTINRSTPKQRLDQFDMYVVYEGETYHILQFRFFGEAKEGQNKIMSEFHIYGQTWRLQSILNNEFLISLFIPSLLSRGLDIDITSLDMDLESDEFKVLQAFCTYYLTRYDFRIDFFHPNRDLVDIPKYKDIRITKRKHGDTPFENYDPNNDVPKGYLCHDYTGYTVGKKKNKYVYLRFYQKQVDIFRTGEKTLYYDYINYSGSVWRLEFQFGSRFTTNGDLKFDFEDTFDPVKGFQRKIFEYLGINEKTSAFSRFYRLGGVPFNEKSQFQKQIMIGQYASHGDKFNKAGINPFSALEASLILKKGYNNAEIKKLKDEFNNLENNDNILTSFGLTPS